MPGYDDWEDAMLLIHGGQQRHVQEACFLYYLHFLLPGQSPRDQARPMSP